MGQCKWRRVEGENPRGMTTGQWAGSSIFNGPTDPSLAIGIQAMATVDYSRDTEIVLYIYGNHHM